MFEQLVVTIAIISRLSDSSLSDAFLQSQSAYIVPTVEESVAGDRDAFSWQIQPQFRVQAEPPVPINHTDHGPQLHAKSAIVMDVDTQRVLWQLNPDEQRSIASLTKLMTALVWFDHRPAEGLEAVYTLTEKENTRDGKELNLPSGEKLRAFDLLRSSIVGSDNDTALALARSSGLSDEAFVASMNHKARSLGMTRSVFVDPTGLRGDNIATVRDVAVLARHAFFNPHIQEPAQMKEHLQETVDSHLFTRVRTTNRLLFDPSVQIVGGKTGYTRDAGYCVALQVQEPNSGRDIIVVVLGAESDFSRFTEAKQLIDWTVAHYEWPR